MKPEEAAALVREMLADNGRRLFPFLNPTEEKAIRALLAGYEAALRRADAAVKCIHDVETYGELGSLVYMMRTIAKWRGPCAENEKKDGGLGGKA